MRESPPHKRFLVGRGSPFMRLAEHLYGASRLVQATSAWSAKTRRAPSRDCRDAKVYRLATTAMHDDEYTPAPLLVSNKRQRGKRQRGTPYYIPLRRKGQEDRLGMGLIQSENAHRVCKQQTARTSSHPDLTLPRPDT